MLQRIITCLNFPGDCIGANKLPYKGARSYLVDCMIIRRLLWEWEFELNSRQPLQRTVFLFVRTFLHRSPVSLRTRIEYCYWLTIGKDFIGSFGADWSYWAQVLHASHVLDGLLHSCPKEDFTCHTYVRFSTKVFGVDLGKHVLLHRLRYHNFGVFVNNAIFHWQFIPIIPAGVQRLWDVCSVCWPPVDNDFV